jgi:hypothetical protein
LPEISDLNLDFPPNMTSIELMGTPFVSRVHGPSSLESDMSRGEECEETRLALAKEERVPPSGSQHASKGRISNEEWELAKSEIEQIYLDETVPFLPP